MNAHNYRLLVVVAAGLMIVNACSSAGSSSRPSLADFASTPMAASAPAIASHPAPPPHDPQASGQAGPAEQGADPSAPAYNLDQAISDRAQLDTLAFDAFGFLTGNINSDSFFPPGKVADFWGFQYLRDTDPTQMGHNTDFLTSASLNMLNILTEDERQKLIALARSETSTIQLYATKRFVLMSAFRRLLTGDLPAGTTGLSKTAVEGYSEQLYAIDGQMSYERAAVYGPILASLTAAQKSTLAAMVGKGMATWPKADEPEDLRPLTGDQKQAVMTYGGDMFSWYAGNVTADVYFCPERHGTYFGSFYLKDAPAVGNPGYSISTTLTADLGTDLLSTLDSSQSGLITGLVDQQRSALTGIVSTRQSVATQLRQFMAGQTPNSTTVADFMKTYGQLDGDIAYDYATAFAKVGQTLTTDEKSKLQAMRTQLLGTLSTPAQAYIYATPTALPSIPSTDFLFA